MLHVTTLVEVVSAPVIGETLLGANAFDELIRTRVITHILEVKESTLIEDVMGEVYRVLRK